MNVLCNNNEECCVILNSKCVFYESEALSPSGINTNDTIETAIQKLNDALGGDSGVSLQFQYNGSNLGSNDATVVDFTGVGVVASRAGNIITVNIAGGGGSGTVTSFSSGNLSPLFTTVVTNAMTTPALTFALTNAGANTYFGNSSAGATSPSYISAGALTKTDDTNVTLTLGGNPATSLLRAVSLTLGWTGTLADGRIASAINWNTAYTNRITSLTTVGDNGAATLISNVLNIPEYTLSGLGGQPQLNGNGFVKATGTTISYDNSTYLTTISGITAGGELSGTYANPSLLNSAVIGKVLTGFVSGAGIITSTDSILSAIQKLDGNDGLNWKITGTTTLTGNVTIAAAANTLAFTAASLPSGTQTAVSFTSNFTGTVAAGEIFTAMNINGVFGGTVVGDDLFILRLQSNATNAFRFTNTGVIMFGSSTGGSTIGCSTNTGAVNIAGSTFTIRGQGGWGVSDGNIAFLHHVRSSANANTITAWQYSCPDTDTWAPGTGTKTYTWHYHNPVYNVTTGTHTIRWNVFDPTLTSIAGVTNFYGLIIVPTAALNGFGTAAPTAVVDIAASSTVRASLRIRTGVAPTSPNDGDIWQDGTDIKIRIGGLTKTFTLI